MELESASGREIHGVRSLVDVDLRVEQPKDFRETGAGRLHLGEELRQKLHGLEVVTQGQDEEGDGPDRHESSGDHPPACREHRGGRSHPCELDDRQVPGLEPDRLHVRAV